MEGDIKKPWALTASQSYDPATKLIALYSIYAELYFSRNMGNELKLE